MDRRKPLRRTARVLIDGFLVDRQSEEVSAAEPDNSWTTTSSRVSSSELTVTVNIELSV